MRAKAALRDAELQSNVTKLESSNAALGKAKVLLEEEGQVSLHHSPHLPIRKYLPQSFPDTPSFFIAAPQKALHQRVEELQVAIANRAAEAADAVFKMRQDHQDEKERLLVSYRSV